MKAIQFLLIAGTSFHFAKIIKVFKYEELELAIQAWKDCEFEYKEIYKSFYG